MIVSKTLIFYSYTIFILFIIRSFSRSDVLVVFVVLLFDNFVPFYLSTISYILLVSFSDWYFNYWIDWEIEAFEKYGWWGWSGIDIFNSKFSILNMFISFWLSRFCNSSLWIVSLSSHSYFFILSYFVILLILTHYRIKTWLS